MQGCNKQQQQRSGRRQQWGRKHTPRHSRNRNRTVEDKNPPFGSRGGGSAREDKTPHSAPTLSYTTSPSGANDGCWWTPFKPPCPIPRCGIFVPKDNPSSPVPEQWKIVLLGETPCPAPERGISALEHTGNRTWVVKMTRTTVGRTASPVPKCGISVLRDENPQSGNWGGGFSQRTISPKPGTGLCSSPLGKGMPFWGGRQNLGPMSLPNHPPPRLVWPNTMAWPYACPAPHCPCHMCCGLCRPDFKRSHRSELNCVAATSADVLTMPDTPPWCSRFSFVCVCAITQCPVSPNPVQLVPSAPGFMYRGGPPPPPPYCESNSKRIESDGNNTHHCADSGAVLTRRKKTPAVTIAS